MKTTNLLRTSALLFSLFLSSLSFAQATNNSDNWELLLEDNGVTMYGKKAECQMEGSDLPGVYAFLKVTNDNPTARNINFSFGLQFEEGCSGCNDGSEFTYLVNVPANSSVEGDCGLQTEGLSRIIDNPNLAGGWNYQSIKIFNVLID